MAAPATPDAVVAARNEVRAKRQLLIKAINDLTVAQSLLDELVRTVAEDPSDPTNPVTAARKAVEDRKADLANARAAESAARDTLAGAIATWLKDGANFVSPDIDIARLEANKAVVLFPARIETRFEAGADPKLRVRLYPDEIALDTHERALTVDERDAGKAYYEGRALTDEDEEKKRWQTLAGRFGAPRAAYIARVMRPFLLGDGSAYAAPYGSSFAVCGTDWETQVPPAQLSFPDVPLRPDVWTRPGEAVLPDRWVVAGYRAGQRVFLKQGNPIPEPLALTYDPGAPGATTADGFTTDRDLLWTIEYATAEQIGMAITIGKNEDAQLIQGYERLVVVGVKSSLPPVQPGAADEAPGAPPADAAMYLEHLFDAHHYTRGLALVPQGTPTNNTTDNPTPFPPDDPFGEASFEVERKPPPFHRTISYHCPVFGDIEPLSRALGVPNGVFRNVFGTHQAAIDFSGEGPLNDEAAEQRRADGMNEALWPITWGYFLEQMMHPVFSAKLDVINNDARRFFRENVRGRGPTPAFRAGAVPYGVLPAVSLDFWRKQGTDTVAALESAMVPRLRALRELWKKAATDKAYRITPGGPSPLTALTNVLAQEASSRTVRARGVLGPDTTVHLAGFLGLSINAVVNAIINNAAGAASSIREPTWQNARVLTSHVVNVADVFPDKLVTDQGLPSPSEYIRKLLAAGADELLQDTTIPGANKPLLYKLIRAGLLAEYARVARRHTPPFLFHIEVELLFFSVSIGESFADILKNNFETIRNDAADYRDNLRILALELDVAPLEEVERLFTETLDVASHRLDAWITALGTRRLMRMRASQLALHNKPIGSYVGAFAWVENLHPAVPGAPNGGFIHAPSMPQAAAAAVLRSGHKVGELEAAGKYAVDLSSERVRIGRRLLDEVREGQPLGAVLGYRFERAMRDNHAGLANLESYLFAFRKLCPLVANKSQTDNDAPAEKIAARNVVDGLALRAKHKANQIPFGTAGLPDPVTAPAAVAAVKAELDALDNLVDAVSDLVTGESVYQLVRGNVAAAGANLDALARGLRPPDPEIARSPRGGTGVTHRIAFATTVDPASPPSEPAGWFVPSTPRPRASRAASVDRFAGALLGDASTVKAKVTYRIGQSAPVEVEVLLGPGTSTTAKHLKVRPLDLVALARAATEPNQGALLDRYLLAAALEGKSGVTETEIDYDTGDRTFPQVMEAARAISSALAGARPLLADDLVPPDESSAASDGGPGPDANDLAVTANDALDTMSEDKDDLDEAIESDKQNPTPATIATLREQLVLVSTYDPSAFPDPLASDDAIRTAAGAASAELQRRLTAASTAFTGNGATSADVAREALAVFRAMFGRDYVPAHAFAPTNAAEMKLSLGDRTSLLPLGDENAPAQMLQQTARVREALGRCRRVALYAGVLGSTRPGLQIVQLPFTKGEGWVGPRPGGDAPKAGRVSCLMIVPEGATLDPDETVEGLVLDEWVEIVPAAVEETGVSFHYDNPGAEAPQAVLVAVPAAADGKWTFNHLLATVTETFDLARFRALEPFQLPLHQALPAIYVTRNGDLNAPNTEFPNVSTSDFVIGET